MKSTNLKTPRQVHLAKIFDENTGAMGLYMQFADTFIQVAEKIVDHMNNLEIEQSQKNEVAVSL